MFLIIFNISFNNVIITKFNKIYIVITNVSIITFYYFAIVYLIL